MAFGALRGSSSRITLPHRHSAFNRNPILGETSSSIRKRVEREKAPTGDDLRLRLESEMQTVTLVVGPRGRQSIGSRSRRTGAGSGPRTSLRPGDESVGSGFFARARPVLRTRAAVLRARRGARIARLRPDWLRVRQRAAAESAATAHRSRYGPPDAGDDGRNGDPEQGANRRLRSRSTDRSAGSSRPETGAMKRTPAEEP